MDLEKKISEETKISLNSVRAVINLLVQDCTVPFIARYRKEATGNLDEVQILSVRDLWQRLLDLEKRRSAIKESLIENGFLTEEIEKKLNECETLARLEDLYLPYKPKRKTKASIAKEKGLEPIAHIILKNLEPHETELAKLIDLKKGVENTTQVLQGGLDIVAESLNENLMIRTAFRDKLFKESVLSIKKAKSAPEDSEYKDFFDHQERIENIPSHRILALLRGAEASQLALKLEVSETFIEHCYALGLGVKSSSWCHSLNTAVQDSWKRLLQPSLENEVLKVLKEQADSTAIQVFATNLRALLLAPPLGQKAILAIDPGIRTGCKIVVLSAQGGLLEHDVIFPIEPFSKVEQASKLINLWINKYKIQAVAVGNGTGGRETFDFCRSLNLTIPIVSISESGASVYSASEVGREEFPDQDVTVRGAVSIGRRLMDPLAELVKIDPKSIGVGQYQHDVDQKMLKSRLDDVTMSCVNQVGVDVNTATKPILTYISGLNSKLATALVEYKNKNGAFRNRKDLLKVKGFGPKVFEQAAGFLRIRGGDYPLDATAVHPENYEVVEKMAKMINEPLQNLLGKKDLPQVISPEKLKDLGIGKQTWLDILQELQKPGVDPRSTFEAVEFDPLIRAPKDLKEGQILKGIVTNVTAFGAFVDIGVHQDGLVHISQMADHYISNPLDFFKAGQSVKVKVIALDLSRKRISLSCKGLDTV